VKIQITFQAMSTFVNVYLLRFALHHLDAVEIFQTVNGDSLDYCCKKKKSLTLLTLDAGNSMGGPDNFSNDGFLGFRLLPIQLLNKNLTPFSNYFQSLLENSSSFHYHYGITPLEDGNKIF